MKENEAGEGTRIEAPVSTRNFEEEREFLRKIKLLDI